LLYLLSRETIEALNTEIQNLTKVIEEKTLGAEDTNLNELRKLRDELTSQRDNLKSEVANLKGDKETMQQEITELKDENGKLETKITNSNLEVQSRTNEMNREIRRKERAEREVKVRNTLEILLVKSIFDENKLLKTFSSGSDGNSKASDILLLQQFRFYLKQEDMLFDVLSSSSFWTYRILSIEYLLLQAQWNKSKQIFTIRYVQIDELPRTKKQCRVKQFRILVIET
jgi:outer membrane murein-binding lipoprotein Lpp